MRKRFLLVGVHRWPVLNRHFQGLRTHGGEQLQGEDKAVFAQVDLVDEHLNVDIDAFGGQPAGKLLVRELLLLAKVFDESLGLDLIEIARVYRHRSYMVNGLQPSYFSRICFSPDNWLVIYT